MEGLSNDNITAFTGSWPGKRPPKYWWMSYKSRFSHKVEVIGPWSYDDNISPFNEWKRFQKASSDGEFIVFPSYFLHYGEAAKEATNIWNTPELKEDFLQPRTK